MPTIPTKFKRGVVPAVRSYIARTGTENPDATEVEGAIADLCTALGTVYDVRPPVVHVADCFRGVFSGVCYDNGDRVILVDRKGPGDAVVFPPQVQLLREIARWLRKPSPYRWSGQLHHRVSL